MAKQSGGYLGGFSGKLGPVVGYMWNGKWCVRSLPSMVGNPRTAKQMEQRALFREQVQLAASMRDGVSRGLTLAARQSGMTAYNLFVSLNQSAFGSAGGALSVAWERLVLSVGPVGPVAFESAAVDERNVLKVRFKGSDPTVPGRRSSSDEVRIYVYCPDAADGRLSATAYRYDKSIELMLPSHFAGRELHVYGFVQNAAGEGSVSAYIPLADASAGTQGEAESEASAMAKKDLAHSAEMRTFAESDGADAVGEEADIQSDG